MIHYFSTNGIGNAWVANELHGVMDAGVPVRLHSLRPSDAKYFKSAWAERLDAETECIYPVAPLRLLIALALAPVVFGPRFFTALGNALFGPREHVRARVAALWHFLLACDWAIRHRRDRIDLVHAQWIHSAGTIAMYATWLLDRPFSFTGHAADLFRERVALEDKIRRAQFIVCISEFHRQFFLEHGARPDQLVIVYCGIDLSMLQPQFADVSEAQGARPYRIRSSGRLVDKKGFGDLIDACALLGQRGIDYRCTIGGSGPLEGELRAHVARLGLEDRIELTGEAIKQEEIPDFMAGGDVYALPCIWATDNDVDGLPQMLMEAMACGLPAISTRLVGIPDLITDGETGILVREGHVVGLADALERLQADRHLARRLAEQGRRRLEERFDITTCLEPLIERFRSFTPIQSEATPCSDPGVAAA